jgi:hypothetical protein
MATTPEPASPVKSRAVLGLFAAAVLALAVAAWAYRPGPGNAEPAEVTSSTDTPGDRLLWDGCPPPQVTLSARSDGEGMLRGRIRNETGATIEKMKLTIKTSAWERSFDVTVQVANNATATFTVFVGEPGVTVESVWASRLRE